MSSPKESDLMGKQQGASSILEQSTPESPPELRSIVRGALNRLDDKCPLIIENSFGLSGNEPMTEKELARNLGETERNVKELREDSLRALMGYGPKAPRTSTRIIV